LSLAHDNDRTIKDFGEQWLRYPDNEGYYGSLELFSDILSPFLKPEELRDCTVAEIGSGVGRIVNMILKSGAKHVIAVEPSEAFEVLQRNILEPNKVTCLRVNGDKLPAYASLDYIFSIGVLHHVPDPEPVVEAAFRALRPGGRFLIWLYGKEGNSFYLSLLTRLESLRNACHILCWPPLSQSFTGHWFYTLNFVTDCHYHCEATCFRFLKKCPQKNVGLLFMTSSIPLMLSIIQKMKLRNCSSMRNLKVFKYITAMDIAGRSLGPNL
jgi:SAM-dependent methyltransferase